MARTIFWRALAALALAAFTLAGSAQQSKAPTTPRLYVFNGGELASETARYRLTGNVCGRRRECLVRTDDGVGKARIVRGIEVGSGERWLGHDDGIFAV